MISKIAKIKIRDLLDGKSPINIEPYTKTQAVYNNEEIVLDTLIDERVHRENKITEDDVETIFGPGESEVLPSLHSCDCEPIEDDIIEDMFKLKRYGV